MAWIVVSRNPGNVRDSDSQGQAQREDVGIGRPLPSALLMRDDSEDTSSVGIDASLHVSLSSQPSQLCCTIAQGRARSSRNHCRRRRWRQWQAQRRLIVGRLVQGRWRQVTTVQQPNPAGGSVATGRLRLCILLGFKGAASPVTRQSGAAAAWAAAAPHQRAACRMALPPTRDGRRAVSSCHFSACHACSNERSCAGATRSWPATHTMPQHSFTAASFQL